MSSSAYDRHRENARQRQAEQTLAGQEIGEIPKVVDPERKERARTDFAFFCEAYHPESFTLPWSEHHNEAARKFEKAVLEGGLFAFAMPRGSGKTTICEWGVEWATLFAHARYVVLIGASESAARSRLKSLKTTLQTNDLLAEDFPEALYPIRKLGRSARRCEGQKHNGRPTAIEWTADRVILPTIEGAPTSGGIIEVRGITSEIRGMVHTNERGERVRPQLAIVDDPQTRESAKSPSQCKYRASVVAGDIAYLAGPGVPISVVMPCTVIEEDDMADRLLDREKHPEYQGERVAMVESFPENEKLWDEYGDLRRAELRATGATEQANEFYRENREAMDKGAKVYWEHRYRPDEVSAIQHAMNLKLTDEAAFWSECQNQPLREDHGVELLKADEIAAKVSGYKRELVPSECTKLTAFIDVQGDLLYYLVAAWAPNFTGYVIDYGTFPDQKRPYFTLSQARRTLRRAFPGHDQEAQWFAGIRTLTDVLMGKDWRRDDGVVMRISRCLVDANGQASESVKSCLRQSQYAVSLTPSYGRGIKASQQPISMWQQSRKIKGTEWVPTTPKKGQMTGVIYDTNYWKFRFIQALGLPPGAERSLVLFKAKPAVHQMIADHWTAEVPKEVKHGERTVFEFEAKPGAENHLYDCIVGAMVGASIEGIGNTARRVKRRAKRTVNF